MMPNFYKVKTGGDSEKSGELHGFYKLKTVGASGEGEDIDWELRPGGMLVQKREDGSPSNCPSIRVKVSHDSSHYDITIPAQATFGDLKKAVAQELGLERQEQRILFRGKEKDDHEYLHMVGVKDMSKVILLEDPASKERKLEQMRRDQGISKACEAVSNVRSEVDELSEKVSVFEKSVRSGRKVAEKEFVVLTEMFMMQLLKLDSIEGEGEAKVQRRIEVHRVQNFVETLDMLKARNMNPFSGSSNTVTVTTNWETFRSGVGSLYAPRQVAPPRKIT